MNDADICHAEVAKIYDQLTEVFAEPELSVCLAAVVHKLASMFGYLTDSDEEAALLITAFANDILHRTPNYRRQRDAGAHFPTVGNA